MRRVPSSRGGPERRRLVGMGMLAICLCEASAVAFGYGGTGELRAPLEGGAPNSSVGQSFDGQGQSHGQMSPPRAGIT